MDMQSTDGLALLASDPAQPDEIRTLSDQELDGVAGGLWFVIAFMTVSLAPPLAGAIYGFATRGPKEGPSCPI